MPRVVIALISSCILLACGDAPLEPASFAEHCGVNGPVRLLALEPGQSLGNTRQIGDRLYHTIGTLAPDENSSPSAPFTDRSTWATGLCGEAPVHLADDLVSVFTVDRWPGVLLACQEGAGIVSLDPTGTRPPHLLFPSPQCSITWADALAFTDHGVIGLEDPAAPTSALHLYPFPDDPRSDTPEPELLLDNVDTRVLVQPWPDAVHALTSAGDLVRVDLADRSHHVEQTDVRDFQISADRRYLAWRDPGPLNESSLLHLRDNLTDAKKNAVVAQLAPIAADLGGTLVLVRAVARFRVLCHGRGRNGFLVRGGDARERRADHVLAQAGDAHQVAARQLVHGRDDVFDVLVAYPVDNRARATYEGGALASTDDLIESDFRQLEYSVGQRGNSIGTYQDIATVAATSEDYDPAGAPVRVARKTLVIEFTRSLP